MTASATDAAGGTIRTISVIYGYMLEKVSRSQAERFIMAHSSEQGLEVPEAPIARFWCRKSLPGAPAPYMVGWTAPMYIHPPRPAEPPLVTLT